MFATRVTRKPVINLNVIPLIDICALTIIFLVMEAYFGESSVVVPKDMEIPKSVSKETLNNAPMLIIDDSTVTASFLGASAPLAAFEDQRGGKAPGLKELRRQAKAYVAQLPPEAKTSGVLLNVIADKKTPYKNIFDVVAVFREAGFHSMLFVARGN